MLLWHSLGSTHGEVLIALSVINGPPARQMLNLGCGMQVAHTGGKDLLALRKLREEVSLAFKSLDKLIHQTRAAELTPVISVVLNRPARPLTLCSA